MNCKHKTIENHTNTTRSIPYCKAKGKSIDDYQCKNCMLRISSLPKEIEQLFGSFK